MAPSVPPSDHVVSRITYQLDTLIRLVWRVIPKTSPETNVGVSSWITVLSGKPLCIDAVQEKATSNRRVRVAWANALQQEGKVLCGLGLEGCGGEVEL